MLRAATLDDKHQAKVAIHILSTADAVFIPLTVLCEFVWVLRTGYHFDAEAIVRSLEWLFASPNIHIPRAAADAGMATLKAGGDFADGVIAYEGRSMGGTSFVSFEKRAVKLLTAQGYSAKLLS